jgi:hypothetical protein
MTVRIAMWSGPRNLSTAMMYAFAARGDCVAVDEPFYAAYLSKTGLNHPMRAEILQSQPTDPALVVQGLLGQVDRPVFYQKHMTHHMVGGIPRGWMAQVTNVFLIRHPARVVASYAKKRESPTLSDLGFTQQADLFDQVANLTGSAPVVIDSTDLRAAPVAMMQSLCAALGLEFIPQMLGWPRGPRPFDGAWAPHWYGAVHGSTGFDAAEGPLPDLSPELAKVADLALPFYDQLKAHCLRA